MPFILLGLFFILPALEIATFIVVGDAIGVFATLALCILSAAAGWMIVQKQGFDTLFKGREALEAGQFPGQAMFDGFCIVVAGALLILPGFVSDGVGFALLIPPVRDALRRFLGANMDVRVETYGSGYTSRDRDPGIVDGTFERVDETPGPDRRIGP